MIFKNVNKQTLKLRQIFFILLLILFLLPASSAADWWPDPASGTVTTAAAVTTDEVSGTVFVDKGTTPITNVSWNATTVVVGSVIAINVHFTHVVWAVGTPQLILTINQGGTIISTIAQYLVSSSQTNMLTFLYTIAEGDDITTLSYVSMDLSGAQIYDSNGAIGMTPPPPVPTVANVALLAGSGPYTVGSVITITFNFDYLVWVKGTPQLVLNTGSPVPGYAYYSSGSGTKILNFQYTVAAGDDITKLDYWSPWALELNGGQIYSDQGIDVDLDLSTPGAEGSLGYSNALGVLGTIYPVYRFYSPGLLKHFLTTDENEKESLLANAADVWQLENSPYSVFLPQQYNAATQEQKKTLIAVHRFYNAALQTHHYTGDANEAAYLTAEAVDVWEAEGPVFYVPVGNPEGTIPVYRFYSDTLKVHLYTIDENEKQELIDTAGDIWNFEGVAYYAYP
ncbi:hypothetical protein QUF90_27205 [Desulfococcaceae bacterium HSG9]|nr:hypothetical protein [Desulfococcaceae bacterium HSG9]